ncbi:MAG: UDP-N-acetylmuramate:L-alanyl-gamma-D-glutamyl-meso-diaminopimelate ligase [Succinivibrionaceae bacterium]|nr:UDP-N-acetylmuramate:L-alanyl-gamma-D-glutamyl-meso-diaminopimelate ligase [Succinivibrionaceae bacterium]
MRIHILGICGTFMGGIAQIARQMGFEVTGSDANVYPPMSTQLEQQGIEIIQGYDPKQLEPAPDLVVVGNAMKRGNPCVEHMLTRRLPYTSGPGWLEEYVLKKSFVLGVAGTHGKTTTATMLAWVLEQAGMNPSFLIGGVPECFDVSARVTGGRYFVIEADEYDCAFFDKRSKFVHYHPNVQILNNLEYDHADIFSSVEDIQRQFHHLVRIIPSEGWVISAAGDENLEKALAMGCWSNLEREDGENGVFNARLLEADGSAFEVLREGAKVAEVRWKGVGRHNVHNALMVMAAAEKIGIKPEDAAKALGSFVMPKRRLELVGQARGVKVYDDFAHHPTAIRTTLDGLRASVGTQARIIAVLEPRSNTMKMGVHRDLIGPALAGADRAFVYAPDSISWDAGVIARTASVPVAVEEDFEKLVRDVTSEAKAGDSILIMSNGGFNGIHRRLLKELGADAGSSDQ